MVKILVPCPACKKDYCFILQENIKKDNLKIETFCRHCGTVLPLCEIIQGIVKELIRGKKKQQEVIQALIVDLDLQKTDF